MGKTSGSSCRKGWIMLSKIYISNISKYIRYLQRAVTSEGKYSYSFDNNLNIIIFWWIVEPGSVMKDPLKKLGTELMSLRALLTAKSSIRLNGVTLPDHREGNYIQYKSTLNRWIVLFTSMIVYLFSHIESLVLK